MGPPQNCGPPTNESVACAHLVIGGATVHHRDANIHPLSTSQGPGAPLPSRQTCQLPHCQTGHTRRTMPADEYSSVARGPLKLKGAKVTKHKKKSKKDKEKATSDVERALATTTTKSTAADMRFEDEERAAATKQRSEERGASEDAVERSGSAALDDDTKTETERRFAEAKRKRVCLTAAIPAPSSPATRTDNHAQLKELTESGRVRPELLKTHKQRVEDLNSHLSRLSEHHDMPKIGPG